MAAQLAGTHYRLVKREQLNFFTTPAIHVFHGPLPILPHSTSFAGAAYDLAYGTSDSRRITWIDTEPALIALDNLFPQREI